MALTTVYQSGGPNPYGSDQTIADGESHNLILSGSRGARVDVQVKVAEGEYKAIRHMNVFGVDKNNFSLPGPLVYRIYDMAVGKTSKVVAHTP